MLSEKKMPAVSSVFCSTLIVTEKPNGYVTVAMVKLPAHAISAV